MAERALPWRRAAQWCALSVGLSVLVFSVVTSVLSSREQEIKAQDAKLGVTLSQQVGAVDNYFEQARMVDLLLAGNPAFAGFYQAAGTTRQKVEFAGTPLRRVNTALESLELLFPGRIGEACFIDSSGLEIARVVNGVAATPTQLSKHEDDNPFFAPTRALGPGKVYQARKYVSPDTHNDVISNSTMIAAAGREGMVHFEIALASFRMPETVTGFTASIIDAGSGQVLVDSGEPDAGAVAGAAVTSLATGQRTTGFATIGPRRVAFSRLAATADNANDWYVTVSAPSVTAGWTRGLGVGSLALVLMALLTILVAALSGWNQLRTSRRAALHDALTGLPNRSLLRQRLQTAAQAGSPAAILVIDLERFKEVNDRLGYPCGDELLRQVSRRLAVTVPADATVARLGGDDFAVLLPGADLQAGERIAAQVLVTLHRTFEVDGAGLDLEARIGLAGAPAHGVDADLLLRHADSAMQLAKQHHEGFEVYDPAVEQHAPNRLALLGDLRRALETDDQITVHYQPKVHLRHGGLVGVEALIRWNHPVLGRIAPDEFIPLAETTTLIHALTDRVLGIAVRQSVRWRLDGLHIPVAVNLSTRCLHDITMPGRVFDLLERTGLPRSSLELEITESMVMVDPQRALTVLDALHAGGIRLSLDDFGTGHSSMAYLQRLPIDELKIDQSFIQQMVAGDSGRVLVRTGVALGHNLGMTVVAEGIEDAETAAQLADLGCDIAQGYHFGRPMPAEDLRGWLREHDSAGSLTAR